jgi:hypothetical protein
MITVIGIFEENEPAKEAVSYLLANEFEPENVDLHKVESTERIADFFNHLFDDQSTAAAHTEAALNGRCIVTIHALSVREAQEAVDVLNNYGGLDVTIPGSEEVLSRIVERAVNSSVRLRR